MSRRIVALVSVIAATAFAPASAQNAPTNRGEIRGQVVNGANKAPLSTANIQVTIGGAATPSGRAVTSTDGSFRIQNLRTGRYRVQIRALGYRPVDVQSVDITSNAPRADVGTVALTAAPLELQTVEVITHRPDVLLAPDRNTYVVRDMPTTKGGNALDVLRNVPAVDVDIDNIVSLRGNSGVTIQINGRPSPMKPDQVGNFLAQLPADMVDKVEIIPNPSARDDPTGVAGIINVVMKQETDAGTSGGFTAAGATTEQANVAANYGYQKGPLTFYGSYGLGHDKRPRTESLYRENKYVTPMTFLEESTARQQARVSNTLTSSLTYELAKQDELSLDVLFSARREDESQGILYNNLNSARILAGLSNRNSSGTNHQSNFESTVGYKHTFQKGHKLQGELRVFRESEGGPSSIASDTLALSGASLGSTDLENTTGWEHPHENSLKFDYTRPFSSTLRLETGYKGSLQNFHTTLDTRVFNSVLGAYLPDSTRISDFTYDQLVNAAYAMMSAQRGRFQLQGGFRVEHAATEFHLNTLNSTYDNAYNSLFPSGLVAYTIDDAYQVKVSYSTRIRRPDDTDVLDPTPHYSDPLNLSRGNPYLKPEYTRALELGLQRTVDKLTMQVTPFFRRTFDAVRTIRTIDSAGVSTRTFANIATSDSWGGDMNVALTGHRLSGFAGASAFHQQSNAANVAQGLSVSTFGWRARSNAAFRVSKTIDMQALFSYQAPMDVEQGHNSARTQFSMAARQKLVDDQLSLTLRIIDPFNTSHETNTTIDPRFYQVSDRARAIRGLLLSVNWTFGKPDKQNDKIDLNDNSP